MLVTHRHSRHAVIDAVQSPDVLHDSEKESRCVSTPQTLRTSHTAWFGGHRRHPPFHKCQENGQATPIPVKRNLSRSMMSSSFQALPSIPSVIPHHGKLRSRRQEQSGVMRAEGMVCIARLSLVMSFTLFAARRRQKLTIWLVPRACRTSDVPQRRVEAQGFNAVVQWRKCQDAEAEEQPRSQRD